ncbi:MFS transporter [Lederbergia sp. NSJ-179]|uniref:MFS transporter n=1 Tax=Lederbergia sp. NSJ-179 TaxID=2931402 RepID=UPI001FD56D80|nr:MFS transporter [Lederbergia sp. NSJ-179]MCJ7841874.1 MFS transporter [Lederbergia sp. NSJ-179]
MFYAGNKKNEAASNNHFNQKLILPMILGSILNPINSSIMSVALIPIGQAFDVPPSQTAWLVSALYLATAIGQPVVGKLIDLFGPRLLFLIATSLVGISSFIAIFAPSFWWLVVARILLGLGTCAGYPASMYLIRSEAERTGEESPSSILATLGIANQTIAVIGPALGGVLIGTGGWQSIFIVNIPLSLACILLGYFRFPKVSSKAAGEEKKLLSIDFTGIILFGITLTTLLLFLMNPGLSKSAFLLVAVIAGGIFVIAELKMKNPFIDIRVFSGNIPLVLTYARGLLSGLVAYSFIYGFPQWLEDGRGLSASIGGLLMLPMSLTAIIVTQVTGKSPAIRLKLIAGSIVQFIAVTLLLFTHHTTSVVFIAIIVLLLGIPQGLLNLGNQNAVYYQANRRQIGASAGLLRTFMYLGAILASAANGLFLKSGANTPGIHHIGLFCGGVTLVLILITLLDRSLNLVSHQAEAKS